MAVEVRTDYIICEDSDTEDVSVKFREDYVDLTQGADWVVLSNDMAMVLVGLIRDNLGDKK